MDGDEKCTPTGERFPGPGSRRCKGSEGGVNMLRLPERVGAGRRKGRADIAEFRVCGQGLVRTGWTLGLILSCQEAMGSAE